MKRYHVCLPNVGQWGQWSSKFHGELLRSVARHDLLSRLTFAESFVHQRLNFAQKSNSRSNVNDPLVFHAIVALEDCSGHRGASSKTAGPSKRNVRTLCLLQDGAHPLIAPARLDGLVFDPNLEAKLVLLKL